MGKEGYGFVLMVILRASENFQATNGHRIILWQGVGQRVCESKGNVDHGCERRREKAHCRSDRDRSFLSSYP